MSRPEHLAPPDVYYNETEARKYGQSSRMFEIQSSMTERALELLRLPSDKTCYLLDVGCGSGLSGEVITEAGHVWTGIDISTAMLGVAKERGVDGDMIYTDMGQGVHFRPGVFDGCISISALQWLCNADMKEHFPHRRLKQFFSSLYVCLAKGARAVFQFYPETPQAMELITSAAMRSGFSGGLVVDYPNSTKAKKIFLCLFAGESAFEFPQALEEGVDEKDTVQFTKDTRRKKKKAGEEGGVKSRIWVQNKKDRQRRQGKQVRADSKYTARKRRAKF